MCPTNLPLYSIQVEEICSIHMALKVHIFPAWDELSFWKCKYVNKKQDYIPCCYTIVRHYNLLNFVFLYCISCWYGYAFMSALSSFCRKLLMEKNKVVWVSNKLFIYLYIFLPFTCSWVCYLAISSFHLYFKSNIHEQNIVKGLWITIIQPE